MKLKIIVFVSVLAVLVLSSLACSHASAQAQTRKPLYYTCPMHPAVHEDKPGSCPICGMNLVPVYAADKTKAAPVQTAPPSCCAAPTGTNQP